MDRSSPPAARRTINSQTLHDSGGNYLDMHRRFQGTCYKAANWLYLGQTQGRGKLGPAGKQRLPIKDVWVYPLDRRFREVQTR
jgi:hypothetical protein